MDIILSLDESYQTLLTAAGYRLNEMSFGRGKVAGKDVHHTISMDFVGSKWLTCLRRMVIFVAESDVDNGDYDNTVHF